MTNTAKIDKEPTESIWHKYANIIFLPVQPIKNKDQPQK